MKEQTLASRKKNRNKRNMYSIKMKRCEKDFKNGKKNRKMEKGQKKTGSISQRILGFTIFNILRPPRAKVRRSCRII